MDKELRGEDSLSVPSDDTSDAEALTLRELFVTFFLVLPFPGSEEEPMVGGITSLENKILFLLAMVVDVEVVAERFSAWFGCNGKRLVVFEAEKLFLGATMAEFSLLLVSFGGGKRVNDSERVASTPMIEGFDDGNTTVLSTLYHSNSFVCRDDRWFNSSVLEVNVVVLLLVYELIAFS